MYSQHQLITWIMAGLSGLGCLVGSTSADSNRLPGTQLLTREGDIASALVAGVDRFLLRQLQESVGQRSRHWQREFGSTQAYERSIEPNRHRLSHILGLREQRVKANGFEFLATTLRSSTVGRGPQFSIHEVRWPAIGNIHGEGLLLIPDADPVAYVVLVPDSAQKPEELCGLVRGDRAVSQIASQLVANGCMVVVPTLINRDSNQIDWHGKRPGIPHREFLYRSAFEVGRHLIGYEIHKVLAAVDCFQQQINMKKAGGRIGVCGYGDGGMLALYAAALDQRISSTVVSGYFEDRNIMWSQPLDRNVFSLLDQFGDAELATMVAPRSLIVEACRHPRYDLAPGSRAAPAQILTPSVKKVRSEVERAHNILADWKQAEGWLTLIGDGADSFGSDETLAQFLSAVAPGAAFDRKDVVINRLRDGVDVRQRLERQIREIDRHIQSVLRESPYVRQKFLANLDYSSIGAYERSAEPYRDIFRDEVVGHFEMPRLPLNPRTRRFEAKDDISYFEVVLDVFPDVIAYGILCLPNNISPDERRPVVVCQHGLESRPQSVIGDKEYRAYKAFATELARRGFITFAPQNLYIFTDRFRSLQRKAYPLKKTLFSVIVPQHQQIVEWLKALPQVDPQRIAFYGLSYGGKSAMRIPPLVDDYCLSICSADFNEWVDKNASTRNPRSYVWSGEYEIFEWDLGSTFNYAEMAALIAPRPFMVERGHHDGVADDWTVAWEFAKVRNLYQAKLKLGDRCEIEWFDGPHAINGEGTYRFLHKHLNWPRDSDL